MQKSIDLEIKPVGNGIKTLNDELKSLKKKLKIVPSMEGLELASQVSTKEPYYYGDVNAPIKISALDIGIKKNITNLVRTYKRGPDNNFLPKARTKGNQC